MREGPNFSEQRQAFKFKNRNNKNSISRNLSNIGRIEAVKLKLFEEGRQNILDKMEDSKSLEVPNRIEFKHAIAKRLLDRPDKICLYPKCGKYAGNFEVDVKNYSMPSWPLHFIQCNTANTTFSVFWDGYRTVAR